MISSPPKGDEWAIGQLATDLCLDPGFPALPTPDLPSKAGQPVQAAVVI